MAACRIYSSLVAAGLCILVVAGGAVPAVAADRMQARLLGHGQQWRLLVPEGEAESAKQADGVNIAHLRWVDDYARAVEAVEAGLCAAS